MKRREKLPAPLSNPEDVTRELFYRFGQVP
jgi:hypothetical protein